MDNLIDFDDLRVGSKAVKKIVQAFTRAGAPVVATDIDGKTRRSSGVSYRSLFLTFADGQKVELMVKAPGDIFGVKINGSLQPMKNQADQKKAVAELVGYLDAGRAKFQAKLARTKAELPKGIRTAAPRMEVALQSRVEFLDGEITKAKDTVRSLKQELGEPVMDSAALDAATRIVVNVTEGNDHILRNYDPKDFIAEVSRASGKSGLFLPNAIKLYNEQMEKEGSKARAAQAVQKKVRGKWETVLDSAALDATGSALTKKQIAVLEFIKKQIGIDLFDAAKYVKNKVIGIDVSDYAVQSKMRLVESLGLQFKKFRIEPNGHKAIAIIMEDGAAMDSAVLDAARRMNQKDYAFYVVINGKIESGWEYAEDAKEHKDENMPAKWRSGAKVIRKNGLKALNLDPDNNESWHDLKSLPMLDDAGEPEEADNDLTGNLFAMDSAELAEAIELAKIVNSGSVLDSASMGHAVATLKIALDTVQNNLPISEAEGNAEQAAVEKEAAESLQAALDCLCGEKSSGGEIVAVMSHEGPSKAVHQRNVDVGRSDSAELIDVPDESKGGGSVAVQTNPALDDAGEPAFINPFRNGSK